MVMEIDTEYKRMIIIMMDGYGSKYKYDYNAYLIYLSILAFSLFL